MSRYIFDIETDALLVECTKMHILALKNKDTGEKRWWLEGDLSWMEVLDNATLLVGHNVKGFDFPALEKLFNYKLPRKVKVHDTFLMSLILDYNKFPNGTHSLENWGISLGKPKGKFTDFSTYTPEMLEYCLQDLEVCEAIHDTLLPIFDKHYAKNENIAIYTRAEHYVSEWAAKAEMHGWPFDLDRACELFERMEVELNEAREKITPLLGKKTVIKDKEGGEPVVKYPKWVKAGCYNEHTAKWFGVDPWSGFEGEERMIDGPFCRVTFEQLDLDSVSDVKIFLFRNGWVPTEYNYKRDEDTGKMHQTSPKITEDSLEPLQGNGKLYVDFLATKSRHGILETWIANTDKDGNLHGGCFTIGTPSTRSRHNIIVNVPSADAAWGKEMRALFRCKPGWKLIGCDSASNQARGLAHYLGSQEYTDLLLNGDVHSYNARILTEVLWEQLQMKHTVTRAQAKRILYAFLFGASGGKLWSYIFGTLDAKKGAKLKNGFTKAVPGFKKLLDKLENIYSSTKEYGDGYIPGIGGNRIYVDSYHKLLVYLLQACEKATCSIAVMLTMQRLEEEGIPYVPCIMMHDEEDFMVPEEYAERAAEIGKSAFKEGPKLLGIQIMDGDAKIGETWYDVH